MGVTVVCRYNIDVKAICYTKESVWKSDNTIPCIWNWTLGQILVRHGGVHQSIRQDSLRYYLEYHITCDDFFPKLCTPIGRLEGAKKVHSPP
jgi:hypothetical protein